MLSLNRTPNPTQPKSKTETRRGQEVMFENMDPKIVISLNVGKISVSKNENEAVCKSCLTLLSLMRKIRCRNFFRSNITRGGQKFKCKNLNLFMLYPEVRYDLPLPKSTKWIHFLYFAPGFQLYLAPLLYILFLVG